MKTLKKLDDILEPIMLDSYKNNLSVKEACRRAGVSYSLVKNAMQQREVEQRTANQKILFEIMEIAAEISCIRSEFDRHE